MSYVYKQSHIPNSTPNNRRPALKMNATTITVHNTANPKSTAQNERNWLTNPSNSVTASYHIVVDEREAIECIPLNEVAWHAGDGSGLNSGNRTSIGIEICESGDYQTTIKNTVDLVAKMLKERNWKVDKLRRHFDWSGKVCPRLMYDNGQWTGWIEFKQKVQSKLQEEEPMNKEEKQSFNELKLIVESQSANIKLLNETITTLNGNIKILQERARMKEIPPWAEDAIKAASNKELINTVEGGSYDFYRIMTVLNRVGLF